MRSHKEASRIRGRVLHDNGPWTDAALEAAYAAAIPAEEDPFAYEVSDGRVVRLWGTAAKAMRGGCTVRCRRTGATYGG